MWTDEWRSLVGLMFSWMHAVESGGRESSVWSMRAMYCGVTDSGRAA